MTDDRLAHLLANAPPKSFILLEDIDVAFAKREEASNQRSVALRFPSATHYIKTRPINVTTGVP